MITGDPKSNKLLSLGGEETPHRDRDSKRGAWRNWRDWPRKAVNGQLAPAAGRGRDAFCPESQREHGPADTSVWVFWPSDL